MEKNETPNQASVKSAVTPEHAAMQPGHEKKNMAKNKMLWWVLGGAGVVVLFLAILGPQLFMAPNTIQTNKTMPEKPNTPVAPVTTEEVPLVTGEFPPFTSSSAQGSGVVTQIVEAVFKEMNVNYSVKFYPWTRNEALVKSGEAFAAFPYSYTEDRAKTFAFSDPMFLTIAKFFYYKKHNPNPTVTQLSDLKKYKLGALAGYYYLPILDKAGLTYDLSDDEETAIKKLIAGRVDFVPFATLPTLELIKTKFPNEVNNFGTIELDPLNGEFANLRLLVSKDYKNSEKLTQEFNAALKRIIEKGIYTQIVNDTQMSDGSVIK